MAAVTISGSEVRPLLYAVIMRFPAASTSVAVGKVVYVKNDGKIELADASAVDTAQARGIVVGLSVSGKSGTAIVNEMCDVVTHGPVAIGNADLLTEGGAVFVSTTAGSIDQTASVVEGEFNYVIGFGQTDRILYVQGQMVVPTAVPGA